MNFSERVCVCELCELAVLCMRVCVSYSMCVSSVFVCLKSGQSTAAV